MSANAALRSNLIQQQIYLQRYSTGVVRRVLSLLKKADADMVSKIAGMDGASPLTVARIDALLGSIRATSYPLYQAIHAELTTEMSKLAAQEAKYQAALLTKAGGGALEVAVPDAATLYAAVMSKPFQGKLLSEWVEGLSKGKLDRLRDALRIGMVEGETIEQLVQRVRGTKALNFKDGILARSHRGAEAMVRTAVNHTVTEARDTIYRANDDIIKGVQWVSTLDARTSDICIERDGEVYPLDSGPRPPAHINCRSTITPVLKSWEELGIDYAELPEGTRASMDGQVPAKQTYKEWLAGQPAKVQDEVLGPVRGELFRKGELSLDRFVDESGRRLTLEELGKLSETAPTAVSKKTSMSELNRILHEDSITKVLKHQETTGNERGIAYKKGTIVLDRPGKATYIELRPPDAKALLNASFVHNHPRNASLSIQDVLSAKWYSMKEIYAVAQDGGAYVSKNVAVKNALPMYSLLQYSDSVDHFIVDRLRGIASLAGSNISHQDRYVLYVHLRNQYLFERGYIDYEVLSLGKDLKEALARIDLAFAKGYASSTQYATYQEMLFALIDKGVMP